MKLEKRFRIKEVKTGDPLQFYLEDDLYDAELRPDRPSLVLYKDIGEQLGLTVVGDVKDKDLLIEMETRTILTRRNLTALDISVNSIDRHHRVFFRPTDDILRTSDDRMLVLNSSVNGSPDPHSVHMKLKVPLTLDEYDLVSKEIDRATVFRLISVRVAN